MITVINASAAVTLLEQRPEKILALSGFEPTTSALPVQCSTNDLSKPHESGRIRVSPLYVDVILGPSIVIFSNL